MEHLYNGYTLCLSENAFPLSTDSMLLADFVRLPKNASVLDLGSGCGTLGMLLCAKDPSCTVTGVELNEEDHLMAVQNIARNDLSSRLSSICADLRNVDPGTYQICVSNPPYFSGGPAASGLVHTRREDTCPLPDLIGAAARSLRFGGDFYLVHRPERLAEICQLAGNANLIPKRLRLVRHSPEKDVSLILLQCRKGAKSGLAWDEIALWNNDGTPTAAYRAAYHI